MKGGESVLIHYYAGPEAANLHRETVERVDWVDGFSTDLRNEIVFKKAADGAEHCIPFAHFICVVPDTERRTENEQSQG